MIIFIVILTCWLAGQQLIMSTTEEKCSASLGQATSTKSVSKVVMNYMPHIVWQEVL
jgi:hypothetical protein